MRYVLSAVILIVAGCQVGTPTPERLGFRPLAAESVQPQTAPAPADQPSHLNVEALRHARRLREAQQYTQWYHELEQLLGFPPG